MAKTIHPADQATITELQRMIDKLFILRFNLGRPRGCSCSDGQLCALHAQVYNRLMAVSNSLADCINDLQKSE